MRIIYVSYKLRLSIKTYLGIPIILTWLWIYLRLSVQRLSILQLRSCRERGDKYAHETYKRNISSVESVNVFSKVQPGWWLLIFWPGRRIQSHKAKPFSIWGNSMNRGTVSVPRHCTQRYLLLQYVSILLKSTEKKVLLN